MLSTAAGHGVYSPEMNSSQPEFSSGKLAVRRAVGRAEGRGPCGGPWAVRRVVGSQFSQLPPRSCNTRESKILAYWSQYGVLLT